MKDLKHHRKDEAELEYFKMVVLSVKFNFPQIDKVCLLDPEELYEKA